MENTKTVPAVLSRRDAAGYMGICVALLDRSGIPYTQIGRRVIYQREVIDKWLDAQQEGPKKKVGKVHHAK